MIEPAAVAEILSCWWFNYDEGNFDALAPLLTEDTHFTCRTDTGATEFEEFVRADVRGRSAVMAWQTAHRTASPFPLRHNVTNMHIVAQDGYEATFASYAFVTHIVHGQVANLSSAIVRGKVRHLGANLALAELHVVLDTRSSVVFSERSSPSAVD